MPPALPDSPLQLALAACGTKPQNVRQLLGIVHAQQRRAGQRQMREPELWALLSTLEFYGHVERLPHGGWVRRSTELPAPTPARPPAPAGPVSTAVRRRVPVLPHPQESVYA